MYSRFQDVFNSAFKHNDVLFETFYLVLKTSVIRLQLCRLLADVLTTSPRARWVCMIRKSVYKVFFLRRFAYRTQKCDRCDLSRYFAHTMYLERSIIHGSFDCMF